MVLRVFRAPYDPVFMIQGPYLVKVRLWRSREGSKTSSQEALKAGNHPPSRTILEKACFEGLGFRWSNHNGFLYTLFVFVTGNKVWESVYKP